MITSLDETDIPNYCITIFGGLVMANEFVRCTNYSYHFFYNIPKYFIGAAHKLYDNMSAAFNCCRRKKPIFPAAENSDMISPLIKNSIFKSTTSYSSLDTIPQEHSLNRVDKNDLSP